MFKINYSLLAVFFTSHKCRSSLSGNLYFTSKSVGYNLHLSATVLEVSNLPHFLQDNDSHAPKYPLFTPPFSVTADEAANREHKEQIYGNGERGDADIDVREDKENRERWMICCAIKEKLPKDDILPSLELPSTVCPAQKSIQIWRTCIPFVV